MCENTLILNLNSNLFDAFNATPLYRIDLKENLFEPIGHLDYISLTSRDIVPLGQNLIILNIKQTFEAKLCDKHLIGLI
jgi:hypothetical protein